MKVNLFVPCLVDRFLPEVGEATVGLLRLAGVEPVYDPKVTCCGQPAYNAGEHALAAPFARKFLRRYEGNGPIVMPSGSCAAMVREGFGTLELSAEDHRRWLALREHVFEVSQFLQMRGLLDRVSIRNPGRAVVHHSCHHLRSSGGKSFVLGLLARVDGLQVLESSRAQQCCGFGGVFSMKFPELSIALAREQLDAALESSPDFLVLSDAGCILQLRGVLQARGGQCKTRVVHYAQLFAVESGGGSNG